LQDQEKERWLQICELAAKEQDPKKLLAYVEEINRLLDERLRKKSEKDDPAAYKAS
jgi:hypothetical protein